MILVLGSDEIVYPPFCSPHGFQEIKTRPRMAGVLITFWKKRIFVPARKRHWACHGPILLANKNLVIKGNFL
jgi:hypothetical protein